MKGYEIFISLQGRQSETSYVNDILSFTDVVFPNSLFQDNTALWAEKVWWLHRVNRKTLFLMTVWELHLSYVICNPGMGFHPIWVTVELYSMLRKPGYCSMGFSEHTSGLFFPYGWPCIPSGTTLFLREISHLGSQSAKPKSMLRASNLLPVPTFTW